MTTTGNSDVPASGGQGVRRRVPRLPAIDGTVEPRFVDVVRMPIWAIRGWWHQVLHRRQLASRIFCLVLVVTGTLMMPLLVLVQLWFVHRPATRYYMSQQRDAVLGFTATRGGWCGSDHAVQHIGAGQGHALRQHISGPIREHLDQHQLRLTMTAANDQVAAIYQREFPGLVDLGRGFPRGRRLCREPQQPSTEPWSAEMNLEDK